MLSDLFSVARQVGHSKPGSKPIQLYVRLSLRPLGQQEYHVLAKGIFKVLCSNSSNRSFTFSYPIGCQRAQFFRRALHYASGDHGGAYKVGIKSDGKRKGRKSGQSNWCFAMSNQYLIDINSIRKLNFISPKCTLYVTKRKK